LWSRSQTKPGDGADQRYGALAKDAVRIVRCVAELARQQLADRVGIAGRNALKEWLP